MGGMTDCFQPLEEKHGLRKDLAHIQVEFLRVNHWIKKWLPLDYSDWTVKHAGYEHLPLDKKIAALARITGFDEVSVCEDEDTAYAYFRECVNHNKEDCCNLRGLY